MRCLIERVSVTVRGETEWVDVKIRWAAGWKVSTRYAAPFNDMYNSVIMRHCGIECSNCDVAVQQWKRSRSGSTAKDTILLAALPDLIGQG